MRRLDDILVPNDLGTPQNPYECHEMGVSKNRGPQNGWFIMETPIKMDDLGVPLFLETPKCCLAALKIRLIIWEAKIFFKHGIHYISTGAGFLPSTILLISSDPLNEKSAKEIQHLTRALS